jgi:hypothetical protein
MDERNMETVKMLIVAAWADGLGVAEEEQREMVENLISAFDVNDDEATQIRAYAANDVQMRRLEDFLPPGVPNVDRRILFQHELLIRYGVGGREALNEARDKPWRVLKLTVRAAEAEGTRGLYEALFERVPTPRAG